MCLVAVVFDNFEPFRKQCVCHSNGNLTSAGLNVAATHVAPTLNVHGSQHSTFKFERGAIEGLSHTDMTVLTAYLVEDFALYAESLRIFMEDVHAAEKKVGQKFFCSDGHALSRMPYKRWVTRPDKVSPTPSLSSRA